MLGLNLIHAGFLAAGLAMALPIVIHLLFRQRTRTVPIGSIRFLQQVVREHRRRRRVRQWILLSLRMLAVLLLAFLFARPYLDQSRFRGLEQELVVLVDRSASMQALDSQGTSAFDRALKATRQELAQLDDNVIVHFATFDSNGIDEQPVDQLLKTSASQAATDFGMALSWARDVLSASRRKFRRIVFVTDLQRSGMPRSPTEQLPDGIELVVRDVGEALSRNVSIDSAEAIRTEIRPGVQIALRAIARNHSPVTIRSLSLTCDITGESGEHFKIERQADVPAYGGTVFEFLLPIVTDGLYRGGVSTSYADTMPVDNQRWVAFEARHPERILLVDGQEGRSVFSNETYFLETALRLQTEEASGAIRSFEPDRMAWESGEGFPPLDGYRAVVLANLRRLSVEDGKRLDTYLRDGGSLLIFAGDQVNSTNLAPLQDLGLLPGRVADSPMEGRRRVDHWDESHPSLACFADPQQGDLRRIEFQTRLPLTALAADSRELFSAGDQIVAAERFVGQGRCIYFGSTVDREWTELPRTPMYVPLMRQLLAYLTDQLMDRSVVTSGLVDKTHPNAGITPPEGHTGRWIVTNIDPRESTFERVTEHDLQEMAGVSIQAESDETTSAAGVNLPSDSLRADEIWTTVAWLLLAVLAIELLLSGQIHA